MNVEALLNLSYSMALEADRLIEEERYSEACKILKKALIPLKFVLDWAYTTKHVSKIITSQIEAISIERQKSSF